MSTQQQQYLAKNRYDVGYNNGCDLGNSAPPISGSKVAPESDDHKLLRGIMTAVLAAKVVYAQVPEDNQVQYLQDQLQAIMEILADDGIEPDAKVLAHAIGELSLAVIDEYQE